MTRLLFVAMLLGVALEILGVAPVIAWTGQIWDGNARAIVSALGGR